MPVESRSELVGEALITRLRAITAGSKFWYTPEEVAWVEDFDMSRLPSSRQLVYWLLEGDDYPKVMTNLQEGSESEFFVLACYRWPVKATTLEPKTVRNRLAKDIRAKLREDVTLGVGAYSTEVTAVDRGFRIDNTVRWICVELKIRIGHRGLIE